ncbi:ATPase [Cutibacterium acnes JCM 18918]|nr:ATPase [Cutibacterium acnes JCM 18918]
MCSRHVKPLVVRTVPVLIAAVMLVWTTLLLHSGFTDPSAWSEATRQGLRILVFCPARSAGLGGHRPYSVG